MRVVLFAPQIPQNAGNIARTCAIVGAELFLVRPLGFNLTSKQLKRSGLDYWKDVELHVVDHFEEALEGPVYLFSTKSKTPYTVISFEKNASLVFGSETTGLPAWIHEKWASHFYTIPMITPHVRSLNLSNAVAIVVYEALRQHDFAR
jgi:tRNA (cytidine/uridine-2'-O-)-methyltransferase